ncbi:MAG: C25 family cysteine peptidase, partial [Rhodothermales bacterium]
MCLRIPLFPSHDETAQTVCCLWLMILALGLCSAAQAQESPYDPSWYDPSRTYVKVAVVNDGVHQITGADLTTLGMSTSSISPRTLKVYENGQEIPLWYIGDPGSLMPDSKILFVGQRNRGTDENWAYRNNPEWQSSTYYSLYTDTTFYWLSWGGVTGLRYERVDFDIASASDVFAFRDTVHVEQDRLYHDGAPADAENPFFTEGEGYYLNRFTHSNTNPVSLNYEVRLQNLARGENAEDSVFVTLKLIGRTSTRHRVSLELETIVGGNKAFTLFDETDWTGATFQTLRAGVPASQIPTDRSNLFSARLTSHNEFDANPNRIFFDWIEYSFVRELAATGNTLRFSFEEGGTRRMHLKGFGNDPVLIFNPDDQRLYELTPQGGSLVFTDRTTGPSVYWATSASAVRAPAMVSLERSSDWATLTNEADYVIITSRALRASAEIMADYRRSQNGYRVAVVDIQDVYDQFDYGRPTPIAIRRFVYQTQRWRTRPRFLLFWGDALYADRRRGRPEWEVPSYGKASSDGWFGMQYGGPNDWSEVLALGRIPLRDDATGLTFIQKLGAYESTPLDTWQKRMLMLVGGRGELEQNLLQRFVEPWS